MGPTTATVSVVESDGWDGVVGAFLSGCLVCWRPVSKASCGDIQPGDPRTRAAFFVGFSILGILGPLWCPEYATRWSTKVNDDCRPG